jgi:osmoprotectant transport system substrate-binding protein
MKMATKWSGALALAALISLPLQAAEPVKVGSKIDTEGRCWAILFCRCWKATA